MEGYPPIAEHGLIGDLQTAALVTTDGSVDWFCCPRFDSPSVFASLLDADRGGRFRIAAEGDDVVVRQLYFPDTAILVTRFMTPDGVGEVLDFMPVEDPHRATDRHRLVRVVRCVRGQIRFELECAPRFDYGRQPHELELTDAGGGVPHPDAAADPARRGTGGDAAPRQRCPRRADPVGRPGRRGDIGVGRRRPTTDHDPRGTAGPVHRDGPVLAGLAGPLDLPGSLAGDGRPLGHHPQADDLCPHWRPGRRPHRRVARAGRGRAQLGLSLHLDPGRLLLGPCPVGAGLHRGGRGVRALAV